MVDYIFKAVKGIINPWNKYNSSVHTAQSALINYLNAINCWWINSIEVLKK